MGRFPAGNEFVSARIPCVTIDGGHLYTIRFCQQRPTPYISAACTYFIIYCSAARVARTFVTLLRRQPSKGEWNKPATQTAFIGFKHLNVNSKLGFVIIRG